MTTKYPTNDEVRAQLQRAQGKRKQKDFARELGISPSYLCEMIKGKRKLSSVVLDYLGLTRPGFYQHKPRPRKERP